MRTYPVRPVVAAWSCLTAPLVIVLVTWALGSSYDASGRGLLVGLLAGGTLFALHFRRARRRSLTVTESGVELQYDAYRLVAPWSELSVHTGRGAFGLDRDELAVASASVLALDADGEPTEVPARMTSQQVATDVRLADFTRDWRDGPLGRLVPAEA